ncbi:MAG: FecR domain-containing protein [Chitinophaga sp.]|uniref:FecR family protein n=1 Tax=Chitinophaga sp. TaxID=1869181 RepID=UPI001B2D57BA|nr:FecR family protein [Chitinophaga sp.]MBO9729662.1 FecR domain-containing protein [Chitinophaga sp.]
MSTNERLRYLLEQVQRHQATQAEYKELLQFISDDDTGDVAQQLDAFHGIVPNTANQAEEYDHAYWQSVVAQILNADKSLPLVPVKKRVPFLRRYWWAAAAVLAIMAGARYYQTSTKPAPAIVAAPPVKDVAPGGNRAMLTLSDGSQIPLDSAGNGVLAQQGNTRITKLSNGQLAYQSAGTTDKVLYNTMSTPLGGQYKLILPDGTTVWLNAGSSINYPTAFAGSERKVTITGEAYFEVAKNEKMPFFVKANNTTIAVLGTHFNINAYKDEASTNTTLLEGAVKIITPQQQQTLKPGQQARVAAAGQGIQVVDHVDLIQTVAWKDGFFYFNDADIPTVMRQLARWYNVEVTYEGNIPERAFTGEIGRNLTLSQVLKGLAKTRIRYRIENGNRIVIQP